MSFKFIFSILFITKLYHFILLLTIYYFYYILLHHSSLTKPRQEGFMSLETLKILSTIFTVLTSVAIVLMIYFLWKKNPRFTYIVCGVILSLLVLSIFISIVRLCHYSEQSTLILMTLTFELLPIPVIIYFMRMCYKQFRPTPRQQKTRGNGNTNAQTCTPICHS